MGVFGTSLPPMWLGYLNLDCPQARFTADGETFEAWPGDIGVATAGTAPIDWKSSVSTTATHDPGGGQGVRRCIG